MAALREWIVSLSHFVFNTALLDIVSWPLPRVMRLKDLEINIDQFFSRVKSSFQELRVHIHEKVLFGIPTADSQNEQTRGYSSFSPAEESLKNVDSAAFLGALLKDGKLCYSGPDNIIVWDCPWVNQWLAGIDRSWSDVYCLLHILSLPVRGSEEVLFQWANGPTCWSHLFIVNYIMAFISNYHKGYQTTGLYKQIVHLMPNELGYVLAILLRVVRPIEAIVVGKFFTPDNQKSAMKLLYSTRIFITYGREWDSRRPSALLKACWKKNMDLPIAMNLH